MNQPPLRKTVPCTSDILPLTESQIMEHYRTLKEGWEVIDNLAIQKTYKFKNFDKALAFVNQIAVVVNREQHHPMITLSWGKVTVHFTTFKIHGLHDNDFILAREIDELML